MSVDQTTRVATIPLLFALLLSLIASTAVASFSTASGGGPSLVSVHHVGSLARPSALSAHTSALATAYTGQEAVVAGESQAFQERTGTWLARRASRETARGIPYARFVVQGTHGYWIMITGTPRGVGAIVFRRHEFAEYLTEEGHADEEGIVANFGSRGRIDVRFHAGRRRPDQPPTGELKRCVPIGPTLDRLGVFTGVIRFRGERGFTRIHRHKASGRAAPSRLLNCPKRKKEEFDLPPRRGPEVRFFGLSLANSIGPSVVMGPDAFAEVEDDNQLVPLGWKAVRNRAVPLSAQILELRPRLLIGRVVTALGSPGSVQFDRVRQVAVVKTPPPFAGKGVLGNCQRPRWRGRLKVEFPGRTVSLSTKRAGWRAAFFPAKKCSDK